MSEKHDKWGELPGEAAADADNEAGMYWPSMDEYIEETDWRCKMYARTMCDSRALEPWLLKWVQLPHGPDKDHCDEAGVTWDGKVNTCTIFQIADEDGYYGWLPRAYAEILLKAGSFSHEARPWAIREWKGILTVWHTGYISQLEARGYALIWEAISPGNYIQIRGDNRPILFLEGEDIS